MWQPGDRLFHRHNPDLGAGRVVAVDGRSLRVEFPDSGEILSLAASSDALTPMTLEPGVRARLESTGERVVVEGPAAGGVRLEDGRVVPEAEVWPLPVERSPVERLARGQVDAFEDFLNRLDGLRLARLREADGLGSFLGGRIRLFPHQLYAAERACAAAARGPVRWLLADEVGLGKTVEACLILNRLLHLGAAERTLVVAPSTLILQWLGELWRKYHQVFVLLDERRLADVAKEHGEAFNPFDVYRKTIVSFELLSERRRLVEQAVAAGIDLLVVDEAHHLRRRPGHPGNPLYRAVEPITALGRHVLLLSATPLEDDAHGFFRLLQLLRPEEFPGEDFAARLAERRPLPPCTSAARRQDIGGLPPRTPRPVELTAEEELAGWRALEAVVAEVRRRPAANAAQRKRLRRRLERAMASPAAISVAGDEPVLAERVAAARRQDPRLAWLVTAAADWRRRQEKVLVFTAHRETLEELKAAVEKVGGGRVGIFHEQLSPERRDIEVAQFRLPDGPSLLISTECGGEGRNFEFCHRLVLFDLPWHPAVVEQRIGRLDRIGRQLPTEIVYFRPPSGLGRLLVELYEEIGLFREPLGGVLRELDRIAREVERWALEEPSASGVGSGAGPAAAEVFAEVLQEARSARSRVKAAADHELHRDPYRAEMAEEILARVPPELEELTEELVLRAVARFGFEVEEQSGDSTWLIEFGSGALVDHLPGVAAGTRFLGTFRRAEAVDREELDFFASGHPLVEGVLAELADGPRGRVALLQIPAQEDGFGLLAFYRRGDELTAVVVDRDGERPDLVPLFTAGPLRTEPVEARKWTSQRAWKRTIERLAEQLPEEEVPRAVAAFRLRRAVGGS